MRGELVNIGIPAEMFHADKGGGRKTLASVIKRPYHSEWYGRFILIIQLEGQGEY